MTTSEVMENNGGIMYGGTDIVHFIALSVTANVITRCIAAPGSGVACILEHIERIENGQLARYMSKKLRKVYRSLPREIQEKAKTTALEMLDKYIEDECRTYRSLKPDNEIDICDFL